MAIPLEKVEEMGGLALVCKFAALLTLSMPVLFLTGASGALGFAIRHLFLEKGWSVAGFDHTASPFEAPNYKAFIINATDECSVLTGFEAAARALGKPDLVVSTVGGVKSWKTIRETPVEDARFLIELNYISAFLAIKCGTELMADTGGSIVLIGADTALRPGPKKGAYSASKAAVIHLTHVAAEEGKEIGVAVNCIVPHTIHTRDNESWGDPKDFEKWTDPSAIAETCLFLGSSAGKQLNGAILRMPNKM
jgi:NAD(P)-dependent dehydrogenase (short-subunit alcohol dehydrogenase family)